MAKEDYPLMISIDINEQNCEDYLRIHREQWVRKQVQFHSKVHRINIKEVDYMNRTEFLIESFDPIPDEIDEPDAFRIALDDRNIFLMQIEDKAVKTLKQIDQLIHGDHEPIQIVIGMPLLRSIRVPRTVEQSIEMERITLAMMNNDLLPKVQVKRPPPWEPELLEFDNREFEFQVDSVERFVNICLWCEPPPGFDVPNTDKKRVLLGYTSAVLSEILLDTQMSFNRETEIVLNFRSVYSDNRIQSESKLAELSTHKGYDDNMTHGFVTIKIRHELLNSLEASINGRDDEHQTTSSKSIDHRFEDKHFTEGTFCAYCHKKIWMKVGRECRDCLVTVHKKCDEKFNHHDIPCLHEPIIPMKTTINEDEKSLLSVDDIDSGSVAVKHRSFPRFGKKNVDQTGDSFLTESYRNEELENSIDRRSSRLASAASSAYHKLRDLKPKRSSVLESRQSRSSLDLTGYENISENDLEDIITRCLSDDDIDTQSLEDLFHEKSVDNTAVYAKANELGAELFGDLTPEERKQKLENEIFRLREEIDLQNRIRDDLIIEFNSNLTDENAKRNIQGKLNNMEEKIQAFNALTIFYCSGLKYCRSELGSKGDQSSRNSKILDDSE